MERPDRTGPGDGDGRPPDLDLADPAFGEAEYEQEAGYGQEAALEDEQEGLPTPAPWAAAVAVLALLAFGVLLGSLVGSGAQESAPVVLAASPSQGSGPAPASAAPAIPAGESEEGEEEGSSGEEPEEEGEEATEEGGGGKEEGSEGEEGSGSKAGEGPKEASGPAGKQRAAVTSTLPPIKHVFLIVLSDEGFDATFGTGATSPYLSKTLRSEGELIDNYYAVASGELANEIALVSGQGPTPQTAASCPLYEDLTPGKAGAEGQTLGSGCVYPRRTLTIGDQLAAAGKTWKAYVEGLGEGESTGCRHPTLGASDPNAAATLAEPYVTWRNPFVYFHSVIDSTSCGKDYVDLGRLATDLKSASTTPSLSYISPDVCDDGAPEPCAPGKPAGLPAAEAFLRRVVPEIEGSPAYREGGLIAITFDQAPQSGPSADSSGCCVTARYPNLIAAQSSTTSTAATTAATMSTVSTTSIATSTSTTSSTTSAAVSTTTTSSTTSAAASTTTSTSSSAAPGTPSGGGRVGLLLISKYVKPGSVEVVGNYDHFSLLASIEKLFNLHPLGYAGALGLLSFGSSVYNAPR